jgi:hypothetical protein
MVAGLAEWALSRREFSLLRRLGATHPDVNGVIADLARPGRMTAALNWYRQNLVVLATRRWGRCRVPTRGVLGTDDAYFGEKQMTARSGTWTPTGITSDSREPDTMSQWSSLSA